MIEQPGRPLEDVLAEMLGGKRMLLVLDNAEHLLPDGRRRRSRRSATSAGRRSW